MWTLGAINLSLRVCFYMPMHLLPWPLLKGKRNAAKWVAPHWWLLQEEKERNNRGCLPYNKAKHQAPSGADPNMQSVSLKYFKTRNSTFSNIAFAVSLIPAFRCLHSIHIRGQPWKGHVSCPGWQFLLATAMKQFSNVLYDNILYKAPKCVAGRMFNFTCCELQQCYFYRWNPHISRTFGCIKTAKCSLQTKENMPANCCSIQIVKL